MKAKESKLAAKKTEHVTIRLSKDEKQQLLRLAAEKGVNLTDFILAKCFDKTKQKKNIGTYQILLKILDFLEKRKEKIERETNNNQYELCGEHSNMEFERLIEELKKELDRSLNIIIRN
jgi:uncharacterized protein (DUF1778 family)